MTTKGKLYMIPQTLGDASSLDHLSPKIKQIISSLDYFVVENEKDARRFIKRICPDKKQSDLKLSSLNKFTQASEVAEMLDVCAQGHGIGMISDAGCPGIADPGASLVAVAHEKGIQVIPLVGPSSILLALMASGMNGQAFAFHGYLPIDKNQRKKTLRDLEKDSLDNAKTQLFIETPYRNNDMFESLIQSLNPTTRLCIACDLNLDNEFIATKTIKEWKSFKPNLHKRPCIFLFERD